MDNSMIVVVFVIGLILALVIGIVCWYIGKRNSFVRLEQDVQNSESRIDVYLTKRFDLLTKMVDSTKSYMKYEQDTLAKIIELRNPGVNASLKEKEEFNNKMDSALTKINALAENYPDLKASQMFNNLQKSIQEVEENLQAARSNYNANVSTFNKAILQFPGSLVAGSKYSKKEYFEAEQAKKQDVNVNF